MHLWHLQILVSFKHNFKWCCKLLYAMNKLLTSFLWGRKNSISGPWPSQSLIVSELMHIPLKHPEQPWVPPNFLHSGYQMFFQGLKWKRCDTSHSTPSSTKIKNVCSLTSTATHMPSRFLWLVSKCTYKSSGSAKSYIVSCFSSPHQWSDI